MPEDCSHPSLTNEQAFEQGWTNWLPTGATRPRTAEDIGGIRGTVMAELLNHVTGERRWFLVPGPEAVDEPWREAATIQKEPDGGIG